MKSKQRENDCIADEFSSDNGSSRTERRESGKVGQWEAPQGINFYLSIFFFSTNKKQLRHSTGKLGVSQISRSHQRDTGGDEELDPWYDGEEDKENHMQERTIEREECRDRQSKHTPRNPPTLKQHYKTVLFNVIFFIREDGQKQFDVS